MYYTVFLLVIEKNLSPIKPRNKSKVKDADFFSKGGRLSASFIISNAEKNSFSTYKAIIVPKM